MTVLKLGSTIERRVIPELRLLQESAIRSYLVKDYIDLAAVRHEFEEDTSHSEITLEDANNVWRRALVEKAATLLKQKGELAKRLL